MRSEMVDVGIGFVEVVDMTGSGSIYYELDLIGLLRVGLKTFDIIRHSPGFLVVSLCSR